MQELELNTNIFRPLLGFEPRSPHGTEYEVYGLPMGHLDLDNFYNVTSAWTFLQICIICMFRWLLTGGIKACSTKIYIIFLGWP